MNNKAIYLLIFLFSAVFASENDKTQGTLDEMEKNIQSYTTYDYPYANRIDSLLNSGQTTVKIFSYGSLMNSTSASRTLSSESLATSRPALAMGLKRVFDRDVPIQAGSRWCVPLDSKARGMLNVIPSNRLDMINGVLLDVSIHDLPKILERETGYDLMPVIVQDWKDKISERKDTYTIAYTFHAKQPGPYTNPTILPRPGYYELVRDTASSFEPMFYGFWNSTTYMSDGNTPISVWEQAVQAQDPITKAKCS